MDEEIRAIQSLPGRLSIERRVTAAGTPARTRAPQHRNKTTIRDYAISIDQFLEDGNFRRYKSGAPATYDPADEDAELAAILGDMTNRLSERIEEISALLDALPNDTDAVPLSSMSEELLAIREQEPRHFNRLYELAQLQRKPEWTRDDREDWEYYISQTVAYESDGRWGEYEKNGRTTGSLTDSLAEGGWECELQSYVDGILITQIERRLLDGEGWKQSLPYYYVNGDKFGSPAREGFDSGGHAVLFTPTGGVLETTLEHASFIYRYAYDGDRQRLTLPDLLDTSRLGQPIYTYTLEAYEGDGIKADIFFLDDGSIKAKDTQLGYNYIDSPYTIFFTEQTEFLRDTPANQAAVPNEREYSLYPSSIRMLEKTDLLNPQGEFLMSARAAMEDNHIDALERGELVRLLANADSIYRRSAPNDEGVMRANTNFSLKTINPTQEDGIPSISIRFTPGIVADCTFEPSRSISLVEALEEVDLSAPITPAPTPSRDINKPWDLTRTP